MWLVDSSSRLGTICVRRTDGFARLRRSLVAAKYDKVRITISPTSRVINAQGSGIHSISSCTAEASAVDSYLSIIQLDIDFSSETSIP